MGIGWVARLGIEVVGVLVGRLREGMCLCSEFIVRVGGGFGGLGVGRLGIWVIVVTRIVSLIRAFVRVVSQSGC